ncbi:uncharacterized protein TOT_020000821 [Theileria orientalis strain Shintoku]|uniref:SfiI-subtelomeric related protein family member n=1 Tax=Theileria orientalis strain Shintoku TaxID=869250 RepID=J4C3J8_THEOR|nr:uncharacterized protein TOT_020000821 [Theileria orientalis strain Shintoku]BAM40566.1 uncharacterized protein TOT_020000821 [Theileria orientalis strain Shintoku]|eukprot:XP_009690867.1 uncharacterized protein TOT_020000821 [Theileria orientalis strain Shintoku]
MNLYRNLIAIFLCLFVKYGSKPVESAVSITHNSSSTTPSGGSGGSESVTAEGASTTPPAATETSSVASKPQDTSGGAQTGQSGTASASPVPRARAGTTSAGSTASTPISISLDSDEEEESDAKSESQPSSKQGTGTAAPTSGSPASAGQPTSGQGSTATSKPVSSVAQQASAGQPTSGQGSTATSKPAVQQPSSSPPKTSTDTSQTQSSQSQATPAPGAGTPAPTSGTSEPKSSTSKTGVDININSDTKPSDKFDYKKEGYYATYTPKGNNAFKLVKDDNTEVWKASGDTNYASKVEVEIFDDSKAVTVCLDGGKNKVFIKENANKSWTEIDLNKVNPESVNVDYSYESYSYKCELKGETRTFTAKSGFAFNCANKYVNNKKVELWKTDKENEYSNKIVNEGNKITIQFSNGSTKVITKGSDGKWSGDSQSGTAKPSTPQNGVDLNIKSDSKSKDKFEYKKEGEYVIYTAKDNNAFKLVKDHKTEVWKETNASNYSSRVEVEFLANDGKAVTIFLTGNKTKIFKKSSSNDPWNEIDTSKVTRGSVNINYPNQSYFYHNELKGSCRTFTAKQGFAFNCANEYVNNNKVEIWKTVIENENANKIEVDSLNNDGKAVTVHMPDNKTKLFIRNNKNDPWNEVDLSKVTPKSVNIRYEHDSHFYSNIFNNNVRTFTAKKGFAFNGANEYVNNDKVEIWKTDKENENANKIVYEGGNKLTIHIGEGTSASTKVFNKGTDGKWTEDTSASTKQAQSTPARGAGSTAPPSAGTGVPRTRTGGTAGGTAGGSASGTAMSISLDDDEDDDQSQSQPSSKQGTGTAAPPSGSPASAGQQATTEQGTVPKTAGQQPATTPPAPESGAPATPPQPGAATTPPTQPASTPPTQPASTPPTQPESGQAATPPTQPESGQAATPPTQPESGTAISPESGGEGSPTTPPPQSGSGTAQPESVDITVSSLATASHRKPDELDRPICYDKGPKHLILELDIKVESPCYKSVKEDQISTYSTIDGYDFMLVTQGGSILYEAGGEEECAKKVQYWEGEKLVISDVDNKSREILLNLAVDVNNKQSTDHVTYDKVDWDGIHTFTAIPPSYISTVKRGDEVLWNRGVGDRYVTRIAVSDYDKDKLNIKLGYHPHDSHLQIQDIDDTIDHFADELTYRFSDSAKPVNVRYNKRLLWQNTENKNHKFLNLRKSRNEISVVAMDMSKFYVVTKGSPKVNDESKYNFRKIGNNEGHYFFKKGVQCTEVGVYNEPIWKHSVSEYKGAYPKAVSYYGNDEVVVSFSDFSLHFSSKALLWRVLTVSNPGTTVPKESKDTKKDEKVPVPSPQTAKPTTHHHIKLYQPDPNDSKYVVELDSSKYRFNKDKFVENVYNYYFNDDSKCTLIKLWDTNLWHYDYQVDDGQFPKSLIYDPSEYRLALQLDLTNIFYSMDENGKWTAIDPGLVLYTIDPKDDTNLVQLFTNQYGITEDPNNQFVFYYHFKEGVNCSLVKSEGADVWSQDFSNPNPKYPFKMKYEAKYRWLLLNFDGLFVNCQKDQDGKWNCKETNVEIPQEEQSTEPEFEDDKADEGLYKHKFVRETKDSSKPKTLEDTSESQTAVPPSEDSTQSQVSSQSQSEQAPESQQPARKSASETHSTSTVPKTSTGTGQAQPSSRSTQPKPADAKTGGEPSKQTASQSQSSTPAAKPSTPKNGVDLNIKSDTKSKDKFEYKKDGEYVIYTAKDNNAFKLVKDHKTEVWKETNASNYSSRVEVEFLANDGKAVTIFLTGNKTKIFKKSSSNDPWKEIDTTKVTRSSINVDFPNQSYFYHNVLKGRFRTFTAKQGFAFNCANEYVNNNKVEIWKTDIENENANKIEVDSLNNDGKAVTVHMPDNKTKLFIRNNKNDPWNEVDLSKVTPKSVNIRYEHDSHFYSNIFNNNVRTFTAKKGFAFNGANDYVNNDKVEIWKTDKENENANKIVYEGGNKLTIHIGEGTSASTKVFNKGTDGKWTEDTSASTKQAQSTPARGAGSTAPPSAGTGVPRTRTGGTAGGTAGGSASGTAMSISLDDDEDDDQSQSQPSSKQGTGTAAPPSGSPASAGQQATTEQGTVPKTAGQQPATTPPAPESGAPATPPQPGAATTPPTQPASTPPTQPASTPPTQPESGQAATPPTGGSGQPGATTGTTTESGGTAQPKVKLLKADPSDATKNLELASKEYSSSTSGNVVTYQIANGVSCTQLMLDDVLLWEYDKEQRGGEYPKSVDHDATNYVVVLKFVGLDIKFENTTEGWVFTESGPLAVKFHVVDPNDATKTVELASNNLTVTPSGDITTFTIADNVNCTKLLYGPILLWEHDTSQQGGKHPKSLVYTRSTETLVLKFEGIDVTFAKNDQGQWEFTETDTSAGGQAATPPTQPESGQAATPPTQPESGQAATPPTQPESGQAATPPPQPGAGTGTTPPAGGSDQPGATTGTTTESGGTAQPKVKLLKADPSDATKNLELASKEYSSSTSGNVVTYQIANGVSCTQLMLDDVLLWEYDKEQRGGEYPKSVDHDATNYVVVLKFVGLDIKFENTTEGWVFTESGPLAVKFHVVDPNDATKTVELASNNLTVTPSGDITTFTIADNVNCTKLLYGPILLWEHNASQQGGKHPKSLVYTRSTETLVLKFEGIDVTFAKNDQGQWEFTETDTSAGGQAATPPTQPESGQAATPPTQPESGQAATPPPQPGAGTGTTPPAGGSDQPGATTGTTTESGGTAQPKVKLLKADPSDATKNLELASKEYSSSTSGNVVTYQIANGVSCTQLMLDDVLLWEYDKEQRGGEYPKSVDHDATNYVVVLKFVGLDIKFENTTEGWVFTESGPLTVKFHVVDPNDATKTVELASNNLTVTPSGDITTFTIADNVNCTKLLYGPILLWEHNASQQGGKHPKSLVYTRSTETLVLKFEGIDVTFAKNNEGGWEFTETDTSAGGQAATPPTQPESGQAATPPPQPGAGTGTTTESGGTAQPKVKLLKADPSDATKNLELASKEYSSSTSGNVVTYQIANGVSCTQLMLDDVLLWEYDKEQRGGEYPKSVDHDATNYVVVLKFVGLDIKFENTTEGWVFTESGPLAVKFHVVDPNDATKTVELASNNLTVTPSGDITTFTIADNVNCTKLLYGPILLWEHDTSQQGGKHPKSLVYTRSTETLVLKFEGIDVTFAKNDQGQWEFTETDTSAGGQAATPPTQPESGQAATPPTQPESGQAATPPPQPGAGTGTTPPAGGSDQSGEGAAPTN